MTLFELVLVITSMVLAIVILSSALFNIHSLMKFKMPADSEFRALKRVLFIRNLMSIAVSTIFMKIMYLHISSNLLIFNEWYMTFHYIIFVILYVDTCVIRVYLTLEKNRMTKVRRDDPDLSYLKERRID